MTSWLPSFGGLMRRSRSDGEMMAGMSQQTKPPLKHQGLSLDLDMIPELEGESEILSEQLIARLADHLPARIIGTTWRLLFSTETHGFSLSSLYRCVSVVSVSVFNSFYSGSSSLRRVARLCSVSRIRRRMSSAP